VTGDNGIQLDVSVGDDRRYRDGWIGDPSSRLNGISRLSIYQYVNKTSWMAAWRDRTARSIKHQHGIVIVLKPIISAKLQ